MIKTLNDRLATCRHRLGFEKATLAGAPTLEEVRDSEMTVGALLPPPPPLVTPNYPLPYYRLGRAQPPP